MNRGRPLRITWVVPAIRFTGGLRVVYEHTHALRARGHDVTIVIPRRALRAPFDAASRAGWRDWIVDRWVTRSGEMLDEYGLRKNVRFVSGLDPALLPAADVTLATSWHTAATVAAAPERAGRGAYFLQHYEAVDGTHVDAVDATWRLPLERIAISAWLERLSRERFGLPAWGPVVNGVDLVRFNARGRGWNDPPVVAMLYEQMPWKGAEDGLAAVDLARRELPALRLHLFGRARLRHRLRPGDRHERSPRQDRLAAIYRESDLMLSPSWTEGCALPPMEAMASGCAVVATNAGGIQDYATPGVTAWVAEPHDRAGLAAGLVALARDIGRRAAMATAGREHIAAFTWERATGQLEGILRRIAAGESA